MSVRISAHDWVEGGITPDDAVEIARAVQGRRRRPDRLSRRARSSKKQKPVYGRMYQTPFADRIRNEAGIATIAVGAISEADHVNSIIAAGRADLCAHRAAAPGRPVRGRCMRPRSSATATCAWPQQYLAGQAAARAQPRARARSCRREQYPECQSA